MRCRVRAAGRALVAIATVATLGTGACATTTPTRQTPASITASEVLLDQGCYLCLLEAHRLLSQHAVRDPRSQRRADDVAIVIALRERELGLADSGRLQALVTRKATLASDVQLLIDVASAMPWARRFAVDDDAALRQTAVESRVGWLAALEPLARNRLVADYVRLSLVCNYPGDAAAAPSSVHAGSLLIRFRLATCQGRNVAQLASLVVSVPRFAEARYLLGLEALITGRTDDAQRDVAEAFAALPRWPAAANTLASLAFSVEDFATALARYDDAVAVDPRHRDALLGRVKALSYLERHADAIAAADHLLALGEYFIGDAHYWRAWNLYRGGRYDDAEIAVELAKQYMRGPDVSALAGYVAAARARFEAARAEFTAALADAPGECDVHYALGGVEQQFMAWAIAGERFERALGCYDGRERELTDAMAKLPPTDSRRRAARARDVDEARRQQGRAALQAAVAWLNGGDRAKARVNAERAQTVPETAALATTLLSRLR